MPQEHVELTIDYAQLRSNRDVGMIVRSTDHVKVLHTAWVYLSKISEERPLGLWLMANQDATRESSRSTI
jgi:hypothetical protein